MKYKQISLQIATKDDVFEDSIDGLKDHDFWNRLTERYVYNFINNSVMDLPHCDFQSGEYNFTLQDTLIILNDMFNALDSEQYGATQVYYQHQVIDRMCSFLKEQIDNENCDEVEILGDLSINEI